MISMRESDGLGEAVRNHASLSVLIWIVASIVVQPIGCLKG